MAIFVTYLQPKLLQRMHETEGAYNLCQLTEVQLQIGLGLQDYRYPASHSVKCSRAFMHAKGFGCLTGRQTFLSSAVAQSLTRLQSHVACSLM